MWDRLRPAAAPAAGVSAPSASPFSAQVQQVPSRSTSLHVANGRGQQQQKQQQRQQHQNDPADPNKNPLSPPASTKPRRGDFLPRTLPARHDSSRTVSLLQPLFSKQQVSPTTTSQVDHDFDLLTGLGIDQSPTTRRYEIRRGVAHRVDLSTDSSDQRPPSSSEPDTSGSPLKPKSANLATRHDYRSTVADISPPSSPDIATARNTRRQYDDQNVSPIDETSPEMPQLEIAKAHHRRYMEEQQRKKENQAPSPQSQQRSFIPTMRREKRQNQQAAAGQNLREAQSTERLRDAQAAPHEFAGALTPESQAQLRTPDSWQGRNPSPSFGDRMRNLRPGGGARKEEASRMALGAPIDRRPGWRGASGRTTLVAPVADNPDVPPLNIPRKSSKRVAAGAARAAAVGSPPVQHPTASSQVTPANTQHPETAPAVSHSALAPAAADGQGQQLPSSAVAPSSQPPSVAYPSPPMNGHDARMAVHATPTPLRPDSGIHASHDQSTPILTIPNQDKAIRRKPPPINPLALNNPHLSYASYTSSVYSPQQTPTLVDPTPDHFTQAPAEAWEQPPSRFSVTTYATSAATGTPRVSTDHELPPLPTPPPQFESVMERKRPVRLGSVSPAINNDSPFKISMASPYTSSSGEASPSPTGTSRTQLPSARVPRTHLPSGIRDNGRTDSMMSTAKALPLAPPEMMSANDRVAHLNARLGALGNRRININTAIKQMTELMPQDNLMASEAVLRKREAEKRKVEALKVELSDVQREEYELGLKLHRAYKRLDKNAEYEPTTLWVRRVTG